MKKRRGRPERPTAALDTLVESPAAPQGDAPPEEAAAYLFELVQRLAELGETSGTVEAAAEAGGARLGLGVGCVVISTAVICTLTAGDRTFSRVVRVRRVDSDVRKRAAVSRIAQRVLAGELAPADAVSRLRAVAAVPQRLNGGAFTAASALLSAASALLLGAPPAELAIATLLGAVVGFALFAGDSNAAVSALLPVPMAALVSVVAFSAGTLGVAGVRPAPLLLAGVIWLLPGAQITAAMSELATGHWTSGAGRLLAALTRLVLLVVGVVVGHQLSYGATALKVVIPDDPIPSALKLLAPAVSGVAFAVMTVARPRDTGWIVAVCYVASIGAFAGGAAGGSTLSAFLGAFLTGVAAELLWRWRGVFPFVVEEPAIRLLVPGSIGFLSVTSLVSADVSGAVTTGFEMLFVAVSLAIGSLSASVLFEPRRHAHSGAAGAGATKAAR